MVNSVGIRHRNGTTSVHTFGVAVANGDSQIDTQYQILRSANGNLITDRWFTT